MRGRPRDRSGTAALGYEIVDRNGGGLRAIDYGCLTTSADLPLPERLVLIHDHVAELIETHHPAIVAVERVFFSKNAQTAFAVGQARGVVLLAAAQAGVPVREATPNEVKMGVTGYGRADKGQVGRMVAVILRLAEVPTPDDAADALAIAISCANAERPGDRLNAGAGGGEGVGHGSRGGRPHRARRDALRAIRARGARAREEGRGRRGLRPSLGAGGPDDRVGRGRGRGDLAGFDRDRGRDVGYRVYTAPSVIATAPPGGRLKLHTYHLVREDQQALFGFRTSRSSGSSTCCSR